ncbi:hypothetical protein LAD77_30185 [Klebsiella pneumoniae]|nr:hypothetical protein [Klebsiella pneumoniae]
MVIGFAGFSAVHCIQDKQRKKLVKGQTNFYRFIRNHGECVVYWLAYQATDLSLLPVAFTEAWDNRTQKAMLMMAELAAVVLSDALIILS